MLDYEIISINLKDKKERKTIEDFLLKYNLNLDKAVDYTLAVVDKNYKILATASKENKVLKCFAVDESLRGENITSTLLTKLIDKQFQQGIYHGFLFTKPENINIFTSVNFNLIYKVEEAALLEYGFTDINKSIDKIIKENHINPLTKKSALVMNCNPFTKGHRFLIEFAAKYSKEVIVFVVEEDKSMFPFEERIKLVKEGTKDLSNVKVIGGTEYIISSATFPAYFLRKEEERMKAFEKLDCSIFGKYFKESFNIDKRYVGTEPCCSVTDTYNQTLKEILPKFNIELIEIQRIKKENEWISASKVRSLIREDKLQEVKCLVPDVTWNFLNSEKGKEIMEKIKNTNSPH